MLRKYHLKIHPIYERTYTLRNHKYINISMSDLIRKNIAKITSDFVANLFQYLTTDTYKSPMNTSYSNAYTYFLIISPSKAYS